MKNCLYPTNLPWQKGWKIANLRSSSKPEFPMIFFRAGELKLTKKIGSWQTSSCPLLVFGDLPPANCHSTNPKISAMSHPAGKSRNHAVIFQESLMNPLKSLRENQGSCYSSKFPSFNLRCKKLSCKPWKHSFTIALQQKANRAPGHFCAHLCSNLSSAFTEASWSTHVYHWDESFGVVDWLNGLYQPTFCWLAVVAGLNQLWLKNRKKRQSPNLGSNPWWQAWSCSGHAI